MGLTSGGISSTSVSGTRSILEPWVCPETRASGPGRNPPAVPRVGSCTRRRQRYRRAPAVRNKRLGSWHFSPGRYFRNYYCPCKYGCWTSGPLDCV
jgi:hypothetical protein